MAPVRALLPVTLLTLSALVSPPSAPAEAQSPTTKIDARVREAALAILTHLATGGAAPDPAHPHAHHSKLVSVNAAGELLVVVFLTGAGPERMPRLTAAGLRVERAPRGSTVVLGWVSPAVLDAVAALDFVERIRPFGATASSAGATGLGTGRERTP